MDKLTQMDIVFNIVKENEPIRTEQVKLKGLVRGVSCADRYLRWLADDNKINSVKMQKDKTKTWFIIETFKPQELGI